MTVAWARFDSLRQPKIQTPTSVDSRKKGRRGFDRQQGTENVPDIGGVARPVGAELKLEGDAGHDSQSKVDQKQFAPELGHPQVGFIAGAHVAGFHVRHQNR